MVVGGSGFVGAHVAGALAEKGHHVFLLDLQPPGPEIQWLLQPVQDKISFCKGTVTDMATLLLTVKKGNITRIVQAAAVTDLEILVHQPLTAQRVMIEGHMNIMEVGRLTPVKRIVFTSSISVYAPVQYEPIDEKHPVLLPREGPTLASYSTFKLAAESINLFYWSYHGVDCLSLRLSAVYGFGMRYPMYVKPMLEGSLQGKSVHFPTGGDMRRDYTYIRDVVTGVVQALEAPADLPSRIYNVACGGELQSARTVATVIQKLIPGARIEIGDGLSDLEARDLKSRGRLSIERAAKELGFVPKYSLQDGIRDYKKQYQAYLSFEKQRQETR